MHLSTLSLHSSDSSWGRDPQGREGRTAGVAEGQQHSNSVSVPQGHAGVYDGTFWRAESGGGDEGDVHIPAGLLPRKRLLRKDAGKNNT